MICSWIAIRTPRLVAASVLLLTAATLQAADQKPADGQQVELFAAMRAGQVAVKLIPKDVRQANVLIENKTNQPLTIKLPDAFAGVPVLAQPGFGGGPGGGLQGGGGMGNQGGGGNQGMGGGMGGGGMGGMGMGGGMFSVAPEKVGKLQVPIVCLEHGKRDPGPRVPYELKPIESFTDNQQVIEVCRMLGKGEITRDVAQAAAWHLTDGLSWEELAAKDRVRLSNGYVEKYFSPQDVAMAVRVVAETERRVADREPVPSPGEREESASRS